MQGFLIFFQCIFLKSIFVAGFSIKKDLGKLSRDFGCSEKENRTDTDGFAPYKMFSVSCDANINPSQFEYAKCGKRCQDPLKNRRMKRMLKKYVPAEIRQKIIFQMRQDGKKKTEEFDIPTSCRCVAKKRKSKKSKT